MKVKLIFQKCTLEDFTNEINDFITNKHVIDIKFSTCVDEDDIYRDVLIMYEED